MRTSVLFSGALAAVWAQGRVPGLHAWQQRQAAVAVGRVQGGCPRLQGKEDDRVEAAALLLYKAGVRERSPQGHAAPPGAVRCAAVEWGKQRAGLVRMH